MTEVETNFLEMITKINETLANINENQKITAEILSIQSQRITRLEGGQV